MPIISTTKDWVNGEEFIRRIHVLSDGHFHIKCPKCMREKLGFNEIVNETKAGAIKDFIAAKDKYMNLKTTGTKVILYEIKMSGCVMGPASHGEFFIPGKDDPDEEISLFRGEDFSFDKGMIVGVKARVYFEERNEREDGDVFWKYRDVDMDDNLPVGLLDDCRPKGCYGTRAADEHRIEWTEERHAFFVSLYDAMGQLLLKMKHLTDPKKILMAIDDNKKIEFKG